MFEHLDFIQTIIQGGAVGIAALSLIILYRVVVQGGKLLTNHLIHMIEVLTGVSDKLDRLVDAAERREETK
jgi:hypothetical protein